MATLIFAGASILSAGASYQAGRENRKYNERQRQVQSRIDRLNARRNKVQSYREKIRAEAEQVQSAATTGSASGFTGSGYQGGISSLETQYGANAQYVNQINNLRQFSGNLENESHKYSSLSSLFGNAASVAGTNFGGEAKLNKTMRNMFRG